MFVQGLIFRGRSRLNRSGAWIDIIPSFTQPVTVSSGTGGVAPRIGAEKSTMNIAIHTD
jgi:hypothetical protein